MEKVETEFIGSRNIGVACLKAAATFPFDIRGLVRANQHKATGAWLWIS